MSIKQKLADVKTKIRENSPTIIAVTSAVGTAVATGVAIYYKSKFEAEANNHRDCHSFSEWVIRRAKGENMRIWTNDDGSIAIKPDDEETND